jgi:dTDP-glucose 4,6-dehydratase
VTNCSNNYGPYQFPEKLIPLVIRNARSGLPLPVYGDGRQVRDWLYVEDHCEALDLVFNRGESGRTYNIGGHSEVENIDLVRMICRIMAPLIGADSLEELIAFVEDRPGHDRRYAMDTTLIESELGWTPRHTLVRGLEKTVRWYLEHEQWLEDCTSGQYTRYYETVYGNRPEIQ